MRPLKRSVTKVLLLSIVHAIILATPCLSEEKKENKVVLEEISVTATRLEKPTLEVPASISIAKEEEIEDANMLNIKDALQGMPGVLIESPNQGYDSRLIIRGAGLKAPYGVREIMVLMDGVPITDPDSFTRLDFIDTQLIKQVEVVKGPNSTLWGANAAGGVVNIITKSPFEREGGIAKIGFGDQGTFNGHLSYSANHNDTIFYTVSGSRRQSENSWRRWNEFETTQASLQTALALPDDSMLESYFGYTNASVQLPGSLDQEMFDTYLETGKAKETAGPWKYSGRYSEIFFVNAKWTRQVGSFELKPMIFINTWNHRHPVTGRINESETSTYGLDFQINQAHEVLSNPGTLVFGLTARYDDQATDYFKYAHTDAGDSGGRIHEVFSDERGEKIENQNKRTDLYGFYAQESLHLTRRCTADLGVRYDEVRFDISGTRTEEYDYAAGTYVDADDPEDIDKTFRDFSPRIGISYALLDGMNAYAQVSKGIQTPTQSELGENPHLDLVEVYNYEVGLKTRYPRWSLDWSVYYSPVKNEVVKIIGPDNDNEYVNAGETLKTGTELSASFFARPDLEIGGAYALTDYTFKDYFESGADYSGNNLPFVPQHQYSLFAAWRHHSGFRCRIKTMTWGAYYVDNANSEKYDGYDFITSAMIAYEKGAFEISLKADNLFNRYYATEVEKDTRGVLRYTPAPPRKLMLQGVWRF